MWGGREGSGNFGLVVVHSEEEEEAPAKHGLAVVGLVVTAQYSPTR